MTLSRSLVAEFFFILRCGCGRGSAAGRSGLPGKWPTAGFSRTQLQNHQIVPMHDFHALELARLDLRRTEIGEAAGELGSIQVADTDHLAGGELAFAPRDARG